MPEDVSYKAAKADPVAALILDALHTQDAATYNGNGGNMGALALDTTTRIWALLDASRQKAP